MQVLRVCTSVFVLLGLGTAVPNLSASMVVRHMNLEQMCDAAGRIFRGTVVAVSDGRIAAGGGELATTVYRIEVDEAFKGAFEEIKGRRIATLQMIRPSKAAPIGPVRRLSLFDDQPRLLEGEDYLLLATSPSAIGLSTTVGLKQGAFTLDGKPGQETAVNGNNNLGIFVGMNVPPAQGPLPYSTLRARILTLVRR